MISLLVCFLDEILEEKRAKINYFCMILKPIPITRITIATGNQIIKFIPQLTPVHIQLEIKLINTNKIPTIINKLHSHFIF